MCALCTGEANARETRRNERDSGSRIKENEIERGTGQRGKIRQMESFAYPHFSSKAHVALFNCVTNAAELRARIVRASTLEGDEGDAEREAVNFAFIDARLVREMYDAYALVYETITRR
jgi:hypothetical protein